MSIFDLNFNFAEVDYHSLRRPFRQEKALFLEIPANGVLIGDLAISSRYFTFVVNFPAPSDGSTCVTFSISETDR